MKRFVGVVGVSIAALVGVTGSAGAATVGVQGGTVKLTAAAGEHNHVKVKAVGGQYAISDTRNLTDVDGDGGCTVSARTAVCPVDKSFDVDLGDQNDSFDMYARSATAPSTADRVHAGAGRDRLYARFNTSKVWLDGGSDRDTIRGGVADYSARTAPVNVTFDRGRDDGVADERDNVRSWPGTGGNAVGGAGADTITATGYGDSVTGGAGADTISTGNGDDSVDVRDNAGDTVDCGAGTDSATADDAATDSALSNCETIDRPAPPTGDQSAIAAVARAELAMETCSLNNNRSYTNCNKFALLAIDPRLADVGTRLSVPSQASSSYTIRADADGVSGRSYTISRAGLGTLTRSCNQPGQGDCDANGGFKVATPEADAEAIFVAGIAERVIDECSDMSHGPYTYCDLNLLREADPRIGDLTVSVDTASPVNGITVSVRSRRDGAHDFTVRRNGDGTTDQLCTPAGDGACAADGTWQENDITADQQAAAGTWRARFAMEQCHDNNADQYTPCTKSVLLGLDKRLNDVASALTVNTTASTYTVTVVSDRPGNHQFTYSRAANGNGSVSCTPVGDAWCGSTGFWGPPTLTAIDREATAGVLWAAAAMEECASHNNFMYTVCDKFTLLGVDTRLNDMGARLSVPSHSANSYQITGTSNRDSGAVTFTLSRSSNGATTRTCSSTYASRGMCHVSGTW